MEIFKTITLLLLLAFVLKADAQAVHSVLSKLSDNNSILHIKSEGIPYPSLLNDYGLNYKFNQSKNIQSLAINNHSSVSWQFNLSIKNWDSFHFRIDNRFSLAKAILGDALLRYSTQIIFNDRFQYDRIQHWSNILESKRMSTQFIVRNR